ncbi:hypothetical protein RRG08_033441 [Elysia crispata]|uniref:Uncharacterized protein n=1 Tax=Elysia crispata TaxID=231223 RepID=A0AAE1AU99_9GAST|nr:hypothetical protein RRG08_033441 [Elysia crispata]
MWTHKGPELLTLHAGPFQAWQSHRGFSASSDCVTAASSSRLWFSTLSRYQWHHLDQWVNLSHGILLTSGHRHLSILDSPRRKGEEMQYCAWLNMTSHNGITTSDVLLRQC